MEQFINKVICSDCLEVMKDIPDKSIDMVLCKTSTKYNPIKILVKTYTNEGDLVLDNCVDSGTTGVVCKNLNRNYILIEKEPEYIDIINKRLTQDTNPKE